MGKSAIAMLFVAALMFGCGSPGRIGAESPVVKQMKVNGTELAYVEQGSGATVLLVHGAGGDWRSWEGLRPRISERFRFVSLSRRYHFPNSWADDGSNYSIDQHVEDVAAFIRAMNVGKVHLVGNSYSGRLVGYVALKYPELLRSVVLGEPSLAAPTSSEGKAAMAAFGKELGQVAALAKAGDDRQAAVVLANFALGDPEGFAKWPPDRQQRWLDNARTMRPMFAGRPPAPVTCEQLKALKVPALVVRGEQTRDSYRFGHEALLGCLPSTTEAAIIPRAQHTWPADNPTSAAATLLAFMSKH